MVPIGRIGALLRDGLTGWQSVRLADVLLAMQGNHRAVVAVDINGHLLDCDNDMKEWVILEQKWNLRKDDLTEQSDETISWLADLLK